MEFLVGVLLSPTANKLTMTTMTTMTMTMTMTTLVTILIAIIFRAKGYQEVTICVVTVLESCGSGHIIGFLIFIFIKKLPRMRIV